MNEAIRGHEAILNFAVEMTARAPGAALDMPPPCSRDMDIEYEELLVGKFLRARVAVPAKYTNAFGVLQGGFLAAMIDNIIGPLSFLSARAPTRSIDLAVSFLAAIRPGDNLRIRAEVRKIGRTTVHVTVDALDAQESLVATATSNLQIMGS